MNALVRAIRIDDLISSRVIDADGRSLGKVVDVCVTADGRYEVLELLVGSSGWLSRLDLDRLFRTVGIDGPIRVPWSSVDRFEEAMIYVKRAHPETARDTETS